MKPELWYYDGADRGQIDSSAHSKDCSEGRQRQLKVWRKMLSREIRAVLKYWDNYEDKADAEKYLEYLKFLHILAGGEPCGW